ncbi:MAG: polyphosphate kinase 2 family protein [Acidimicrobiales bacterium]
MPVEPDDRRSVAVEPGRPAGLRGRDTAWLPKALAALPDDDRKDTANRALEERREALAEVQELLWASDTWAVLVVFQALDAAGKDSTIEHVMSGVNPQGCHVTSFKAPSTEELDHDFLWRCGRGLPGRGEIGIFNRSYYEEVLVVRVHPEFLDAQKLPPGSPRGDALWSSRYEDINAFERHLDREGTKIVKFFLHISPAEQKRRFLARLDDPHKNWKFNPRDLDERARWDDYVDAYEAALTATSTEWAPWYVLPADRKYVTRLLAADIIVSTIRGLDLSYPKADPAVIEEGRRRLLAGGA